MECLDTTKYLKINHNKNVGTVLLIVEGAHDEVALFKKIFRDILGYKFLEKTRAKDCFKEYDEYVNKANNNSRFIVINAKNSNISTLRKDEEYLNEIYKILYLDYGIDIKNIRVYFIWDRDCKSNPKEEVEYFLKTLSNPLDNDGGYMQGLLLLSYPNLGSFIVSNFKEICSERNVKDLKKFMKDKKIRINEINERTLICATAKMHKVLKSFNIREYNPDRINEVFIKVFNQQEKYFSDNGFYKMLSFISIIFIDLGLISEK